MIFSKRKKKKPKKKKKESRKNWRAVVLSRFLTFFSTLNVILF